MTLQEFDINGQKIKLDPFLIKKLNNAKLCQKKDFDVVGLFDGGEGSGKSTLAITCAWYVTDGKMTTDNVAEDTTDAIKKLERLPDGSLLLIDEGSLLFSSKDVMKREQKQLVKIFNVIRQKKMVLFIVAPSFFELNKYIASDRSRFLIHVYTSKQLERGFYAYYGDNKKRKLYLLGKKNYNSYKRPKPNFRGRFNDFEPPFYKQYIETKKRSLFAALHQDAGIKVTDDKDDTRIKTLETVERLKKLHPDKNMTFISQLVGVPIRTLQSWRNKLDAAAIIS